MALTYDEARALHGEYPVLDLHADTAKLMDKLGYDLAARHDRPMPRSINVFGHVDIPRLREGSVVCPRFPAPVNTYNPTVHALLAEMDEPILSSTLILPAEEHALNDATTINERLGGRIDAVVDAGPCPALPTTVVDLAVSPPVIVRRGLGDPARLGLAADDEEPVEVN